MIPFSIWVMPYAYASGKSFMFRGLKIVVAQVRRGWFDRVKDIKLVM